ncbi:hypothetical protein [Crinalium epipsammum]|uniref:hypothetical protein n=1 Tax=Crinalium epipsammum TaxID=241425 RepID=UPI0002DAACAD|nr:hypothetical protein [Crinalium epipsammum]
MPTCICCSQSLVRCIRRHKIYWFCTYCHQEMPYLDDALAGHLVKNLNNKKSFNRLENHQIVTGQ